VKATQTHCFFQDRGRLDPIFQLTLNHLNLVDPLTKITMNLITAEHRITEILSSIHPSIQNGSSNLSQEHWQRTFCMSVVSATLLTMARPSTTVRCNLPRRNLWDREKSNFNQGKKKEEKEKREKRKKGNPLHPALLDIRGSSLGPTLNTPICFAWSMCKRET